MDVFCHRFFSVSLDTEDENPVSLHNSSQFRRHKNQTEKLQYFDEWTLIWKENLNKSSFFCYIRSLI